MSFNVWFRQWVRAFFKLLTVDTKKYKSDAQRKKERERRLKAKCSSANYYRIKKKQRKRHNGHWVQDKKLIDALLQFMAISLGVLFLPLGLFDWGRKSVKKRKASGGSGTTKKASLGPKMKVTSKPVVSHTNTNKASTAESNKKTTSQHPRTTVNSSVTPAYTKPQDNIGSTPTRLFEYSEPKVVAPVIEVSVVAEPDENTPKSTPKSENDQYIRKRMIVVGSYYCEKVVLDTLKVGSYIDLEAEPDNPYDRDAIQLLYHGQKIGYIAKKDQMIFLTCLKLNRKIYGAITAIFEEDGRLKYEYETWFANN